MKKRNETIRMPVSYTHLPFGFVHSSDMIGRYTHTRKQANLSLIHILEILARELHVEQSEITKCGGASRLIVGTNKDKLEEVQDK